MGLFARLFGLGRTYDELSPQEKEWVDNCGFDFYSPSGTVYFDDDALADCKRWSETNPLVIEALLKGYGIPPLDPTKQEMEEWMRRRELEMENEKLKERIEQYENQRRPALRNSRNGSKKSRMVRGS